MHQHTQADGIAAKAMTTIAPTITQEMIMFLVVVVVSESIASIIAF